MPSTYSTSLGLELIGNGEQAGTWGTTTNTNLGTLLEAAIAGVESITLTGNYTLTDFNGLPDEARSAVLVFGGLLASPCNVIAPAVEKVYIVRNFSNATVTVKTSGGNGVAIANAASEVIFCDGTNFFSATQFNFIDGNLTVTGNATIGGSVSMATTANSNVIIGAVNIFANSSTGQVYLPTGNTAQRTASPINGVIRYNTTGQFYEGYSNSVWLRFVTAPQGDYTITYAIAAGGAGAGSNAGGGGGAGGLLQSTLVASPATVYTITIGGGGAGGSSGSDSSIVGTATSTGGGRGGSFGPASGVTGGSGGGGSANDGSGTSSGGAGIPGQGNNGGGSASGQGGGGGGGSDAAGGNGNFGATEGGAGGSGTTLTITGVPLAICGGGGGSAGYYGTGAGGAGGAGGGGAGAITGVAGTAGTVNTGGGGGGGGAGPGVAAGAGGSGCIYISMPTVSYSGTTTGLPTVTTYGSTTVLRYTTSGSYTA